MAGSMASSHVVLESLPLYRKTLQSLNLTEQPPGELRNHPDDFIGEDVHSSSSATAPISVVGNQANLELPIAAGLDNLSAFPSSFPSVKRIPGTQFVVDGFRSAGPWSVSYFLSHFHSDHYTGLTNVWNKGLVFCSEITAHLVRDSLQVVDGLVVSLPMGTTVVIDGCEVTLVDANHCPGAVQFLFRVPGEAGEWQRYVHCGDMRFSPAMTSDTSLCDFVGADAVFLDTTYCNPKFVFPSQQTSVNYVADTVQRLMGADLLRVSGEDVSSAGDDNTMEGGDGSDDEAQEARLEGQFTEDLEDELSRKSIHGNEEEDEEPVYDGRSMDHQGVSEFKSVNGMSTLFLISTYVIGKEKILTAVAKKCNCLIYVTEKKLSILKRLEIEEIEVFTTDPAATNVHVVKWSFLGETWPYFRPNFVNMEKIMLEGGHTRVVGFVPTGWTYELKKKTFSVRKKGPLEIHLVPYSEHSNYEELREYVGFLRPKEIIPTVGLDGGGMESKAVVAMRKHFRNLVDETASKRNFLKGFRRKLPAESNSVAAPKAVFGRTARKRIRETDEEFAEEGMEPPLLRADYQHDVTRNEDTDHSSLPQKLSAADEEKIYLQGLETAAMELSEAYLEDGSKPFLSTIKEEDEHTQEGAGLSKALGKQQLGPQHSPQVTIQSRKVINNQVSLSQSVNVSSSRRSLASKSKTSKSPSGKSRVTQKKPLAVKTGKKSSTSPLPFKKVRVNQTPASAAALISRNQKAMQSSILNFFRKTGEDLNPTTQSESLNNVDSELAFIVGDGKASDSGSIQVQRGKNNWADEYDQLASVLDGNLSEEQAHVLLERAGGNVGIALDLFYMDQRVSDASAQPNVLAQLQEVGPIQSQRVQTTVSDGNSGSLHSVDLVAEIVTRDGVYKTETPQLQLEEAKWAAEYEQLALILDGNLSKEDAYVLLERAGGDVAVAVDSFYTKQSVSESTFPLNSNPQSHLNRGDSKVRHCSQVTPSAGEENHVRSPEGREEMASKTPNSMLLSSGASSSLPSPAKKNLDGSSFNSALEKKLSSVAVPVEKYTPLDHACWEAGLPAPYLHLARAFDLIEQESGRLRTADMLCNMFRSLLALSPEAVLPAIYLTTNRIAPDFESGDLSIGGSLVTSAITEAAGVSRAKLKEMYTSMGDLGDVAQACRQRQSSLRLPPPLGICQVFSTLKQISNEAGTGSGARKKDLVLSLLRACREKEMKYIVRTLIQNMRIGAMMKTVLSALARAVVVHHSFPAGQAPDKALVKLKPKFQEASAAVVEAYNFLPNLDVIVPTLIKDGVEGLSANFTVSPGTPIKPMLAKITNGIPELLKRFQGQPFTCEYKYDGQRAQIHMLLDGTIRIFTRDSGDATGRFPDVITIVQDAARADLKSFIIDAEVVAVDRENDNKLMAFQHLSTRERGSRDGSSVSLQNIKVHVAVFVFDMMFANNEPLVKIPFQERRKRMHHWFPNSRPGYFGYASEITVAAEEDPVSVSQKVQGYLEEAFAASCEGLMAKALVEDSSYMASKRSDSWLKIKRDYVEGLQDSLDLVPIGAWYGNGRKAGWYSPFLLACYDPDREEYQSVCRVMSGFTDVFYKEITEFYSGDHVLPRKPPYYSTGEEPDVWFTPELVWEIRGADFTVSPVHQAALGLIHPTRGISMRFPRFIRSRLDKKPEIGSSPSEIADLFHKQTRKLEVVPGSSAKAITRPDSPD